MHIEHDWWSIERSEVGPHPTRLTLGFGTPPWTWDPTNVDGFHDALRRWVERYQVARCTVTREPLVPSWLLAAASTLWGNAPSNALGELVSWALRFEEDAPTYAAAAIVAYQTKLVQQRVLRDDSAVKRLRLLRRVMRDLEDPQGPPDEARDD